MQLSNVICDCDCDATLGASWARVCIRNGSLLRQHNLSSYCLCSRRESDAACSRCCYSSCLFPLLLPAPAAAAAADVAAVVINRIVNRKLCLCFVCLLLPVSLPFSFPLPPIVDTTTLSWVGALSSSSTTLSSLRCAVLLCSAQLGIVAENYYSGYYSQSITLPQRHTHTDTHTDT